MKAQVPSPPQALLTSFFLTAGGISFLIASNMVIRLGGWGSNSVHTQAHFNKFSGDGERETLVFLNMMAEALGSRHQPRGLWGCSQLSPAWCSFPALPTHTSCISPVAQQRPPALPSLAEVPRQFSGLTPSLPPLLHASGSVSCPTPLLMYSDNTCLPRAYSVLPQNLVVP